MMYSILELKNAILNLKQRAIDNQKHIKAQNLSDYRKGQRKSRGLKSEKLELWVLLCFCLMILDYPENECDITAMAVRVYMGLI